MLGINCNSEGSQLGWEILGENLTYTRELLPLTITVSITVENSLNPFTRTFIAL